MRIIVLHPLRLRKVGVKRAKKERVFCVNAHILSSLVPGNLNILAYPSTMLILRICMPYLSGFILLDLESVGQLLETVYLSRNQLAVDNKQISFRQKMHLVGACSEENGRITNGSSNTLVSSNHLIIVVQIDPFHIFIICCR